MDRETFDALARQVARRGSRRVALGALASAVFLLRPPAPLLARKRKGKGKGKGKKKRAKVVVCHNGKAFSVSRSAVRGVLLDGGTVGLCPGTAECQTCTNGACVPVPDGTPCGDAGSGLRCCDGACPSPACLPLGTCCGSIGVCQATCCTHRAETGCPLCGTQRCCGLLSVPGGPCGRDDDCGGDACICGVCQPRPAL
jgi:hypothetical protein